MICWSDVCFDVFFIVCLGMHSLVFTCLVALATDRNDSDLKSGLCLSVVSTPRHVNTFAFKPRPLYPQFFWCPIVPVHVSMYVLMWVFKCVLPNALMYVLINVPMYVLINALMYVLIKVLMYVLINVLMYVLLYLMMSVLMNVLLSYSFEDLITEMARSLSVWAWIRTYVDIHCLLWLGSETHFYCRFKL
jgi:hypothetical protein